MKTKFLLSTVLVAILGVQTVHAEPGDMGVMGENAWTQNDVVRAKHIDSFGDVYYTYAQEVPCVAKQFKKVQTKAEEKWRKEVSTAFNETVMALSALDNNNIDDAKKQLKSATDKFNTLLKNNPEPRSIPLSLDVDIYHADASAKEVEAITNDSIKLLKDHQIQDANMLLSGLKDEIDVTTHSIPMELYPLSTQTAYDKLKNGDTKGAREALLAGFDTVEMESVVIPIAILESQDEILSAAAVEKSDKSEAIKHVKSANMYLEKAKMLGYTTKYSDTYMSLHDQIHAIQKEINGKNEVEKLYEKIKVDYNKFLDGLIGKIPMLVG